MKAIFFLIFLNIAFKYLSIAMLEIIKITPSSRLAWSLFWLVMFSSVKERERMSPTMHSVLSEGFGMSKVLDKLQGLTSRIWSLEAVKRNGGKVRLHGPGFKLN